MLKNQEKPHYYGHRKRLRDRLVKAPNSLADYEILELVLACVIPKGDTKPLAKKLLARFKTLAGVMAAPSERLMEIQGFGPTLAAHWVLQRELSARISEEPIRQRMTITGPEIVAEAAMARLGGKPLEEFWAALVDNKNRVMAWEKITAGTVDRIAVFPRQILTFALKHQAAGVLLVHNHPGGDPNPSREDVDLTIRIANSSKELDIRILDHIMVTETEYYSFQEHGLL